MKKKPTKNKPIATLTIRGLDTLSPGRIQRIASWLLKKTREIDKESIDVSHDPKSRSYSNRFTTRFYL